jgi:hypothetical protein
MKKLFLSSILAFIISSALSHQAQAKVDYMEILSIGTSTTASLATGSSTVLADTTRGYDRYKHFEAWIQYDNTTQTTIPMRYSITTINPTATSGAMLKDGDILILRSLTDMQNFKACAGTTTAASYGTASVMYMPSHDADKGPVYINP